MLHTRLLSLLGLTAFITTVVMTITLLHRLGPDEASSVQRIDWSIDQQKGAPTYLGIFIFPSPSATAGSQALYLEALAGAATIRLNGIRLPHGGTGHDSVIVGEASPLLLSIPAALLRDGSNEIAIEFAPATIGIGFVGDSYFGAEAKLAPDFALRHFLKHTLLVSLIVASFVLACVSFALWLRRRQEQIYAWNALACFTGSAYSVLPISHAALPAPWMDVLMLVLFLWFVVAAAWLGLCLASQRQARTRRVITFTSFGGSAVFIGLALVVSAVEFRLLLPWLYALVILLGTYTTSAVFWRQYLTRWDATSFWMLAAVMCICMASLHDGALLFGVIAPGDGFWLAYGSPPPMIVFTSILLRHFVRALAESESLNRDLEQRVASREAQIAEDYRALQRADRERAVNAERERLFGDLHDGLGGTLMATLSRLSNAGAADSAAAHGVQAALEDLRLTLASLNPDERSLRAALAPLRERLAAACADVSMALSFDLGDVGDDFELPKSQTLHLLRIIQEAGMNAIRHARGQRLRIAIAITAADGGERALDVRIEDDGCGMPAPDAMRPGHYGLSTLRRRARQIGAYIDWEPLQPGTCVRLRLPLAAAR